MKYDKSKYVGKKINLYPGDTYKKIGIIEDVDDLGFTFLITETEEKHGSYVVGKSYFISHSTNIKFQFIN